MTAYTLFVSTSPNIADYDAFVTAQANTEAALSSISWQVIGSTPTVSARDHTGTGPASYPGVPIFLLNDVRLVDSYADLWDGSLDVPLNVDQHGNSVPGPNQILVWTGTQTTGLPLVGYELGSAHADFGIVNLSNSEWTCCHSASATYGRLYAISGVLTAPLPEPSLGMLLFLGFPAAALLRGLRSAAPRR